MKAITFKKYGTPAELREEEVEMPVPKAREVLIKMKAASINSWDVDLLKGTPLVNRLLHGLFRPKTQVLGCDIAGEVVAIGTEVKDFQVGDAVYGDVSGHGWGGFAEYVCAPTKALRLKPDDLSFEQAAATPQAAVMALQSLRDKTKLKPGQKVLMNGAGGGVGTFVLQMTQAYGVEVTAVDSREKTELMRALGAAHCIDYKQEDFTRNGEQYDLIIDVIGNRSIFSYQRALAPKGRYLMVGGTATLIFQLLLIGPWIALFTKKRLGLLVHQTNKGLGDIHELFRSQGVVPVIERTYSLAQTAKAVQSLGDGLVQGKVVVTMEG